MPLIARAKAALGLGGGSRAGRLRLTGFAFLAALAAVIAVGLSKPDPFSSPRTVTAVFDETASLGKILRTVRVEGVNVGTIGEVRRVGDDAEIEFVLEEDVGTIHADARAEIRPHIFFEGTVFIELYPGSDDAPALGAGVIPKHRTEVFIPFDVALRALDGDFRKALRGAAAELAPGLGGGAVTGVRRTLHNAPALLEDLGPAARAAQGPHRTELRGAVRSLSGTLGGLAAQEERIAPLVADARRTIDAVGADATAPLDATLRALPPTLVELDRGGEAFEAILDRLDPLAVDLEPALAELAPTLREARPLLADARPVLVRATPFLRDLRRALDLTAEAAPETEALLETLAPGVDLLAGSTLPHLHRDTGLGIPNYIQLGSFVSGFTGSLRPYQTPAQNPAGAGHFARVDTNFLVGSDVASPPSCDLLSALDPDVVAELAAAGLCSR